MTYLKDWDVAGSGASHILRIGMSQDWAGDIS